MLDANIAYMGAPVVSSSSAGGAKGRGKGGKGKAATAKAKAKDKEKKDLQKDIKAFPGHNSYIHVIMLHGIKLSTVQGF